MVLGPVITLILTSEELERRAFLLRTAFPQYSVKAPAPWANMARAYYSLHSVHTKYSIQVRANGVGFHILNYYLSTQGYVASVFETEIAADPIFETEIADPEAADAFDACVELLVHTYRELKL